MPAIRFFQSLWATELRLPGVPEAPVAERFERVKAAGYDGMAIDLGAMDIQAARRTVPEFARNGLRGLLTAFPRSVEELRPALHLAKEIGSPFVIVVGQVMPVAVADMVPVVRAWIAMAAEEGMPIQFETHRNCITNDLFATLQLLDAVPEMRLSADLSHYVVDREIMLPLDDEMAAHFSRILARADSFQGRIATRCQVQVPIRFRQHHAWVELFRLWWKQGFDGWKSRAGEGGELIFLCELGPRPYAITDEHDMELSDRWLEALELRAMAGAIWNEEAGITVPKS